MSATIRDSDFEEEKHGRARSPRHAPAPPIAPGPRPAGLRVYIVTDSSSFRPPFTGGGTERQLSALAQQLEHCGADVTVLARECPESPASERSPEAARDNRADGLRIEYVQPAPVAKGTGWAALGPNMRYIAGTFARLFRARQRYDVLIISGFRQLALPAALMARLARKPCIIRVETAWDLNDELSPESNARIGRTAQRIATATIRASRRLAFGLTDYLVAFSDALEERLGRLGAESAKVRQIPNGVDTERFAPVGSEGKAALRRALGLPPDRTIFIYTGRICRSKGLRELMDVWQRLGAEGDPLLLLVGSGIQSHENCEAEVMESVARRPGSIIWRSAVDNVAQYLQAADVFILLSYFETFSLSMLEAVSAGLPCLVSDVGVARQIVRHHETGAIVPVHAEPEVVLCEIEWLLARRSEWDTMGAIGRASIENGYSLQAVARRYIALLDADRESGRGLRTPRHA